MKAISLLVAAALAAAVGPAAAADLPSAVAPPPPPPPPVFTWTGLYLGTNIGFTWGARQGVNSVGLVAVDHDPLFGLISAAGATGVTSPSLSGAFGGGQIGYNYQFSPRIVVGLEADIQGAAVQGSETAYSLLNVPNISGYSITTVTQVSRNLDYLGTVRARVGYAVRPDALLYLTGGLAYGRTSQTVTQTQLANWSGSPGFPADTDAFGFASSQFADTRFGWTAGGGVEWAFRENWSAKFEYLYYDLGRVRSTGLLGFDTNAIPGPDFGGTGLVAIESSSRFNGHILRAGLNYRFQFFRPPVVATY